MIIYVYVGVWLWVGRSVGWAPCCVWSCDHWMDSCHCLEHSLVIQLSSSSSSQQSLDGLFDCCSDSTCQHRAAVGWTQRPLLRILLHFSYASSLSCSDFFARSLSPFLFSQVFDVLPVFSVKFFFSVFSSPC